LKGYLTIKVVDRRGDPTLELNLRSPRGCEKRNDEIN